MEWPPEALDELDWVCEPGSRYDVGDFLCPSRAWLFRITHVENLAWILDHGLHCRSSTERDADFREIGQRELIARRARRAVPIEPFGTLADYVPFYFTPWSPMQMNVTTGHAGTPRTLPREVAILVTSMYRLDAHGDTVLVTDRHAYLRAARFTSGLPGLAGVDWDLLRRRDFQRAEEDPGKLERYQAEALVHRHLPIDRLAGIAVRDCVVEARIQTLLQRRGLSIKLATKPDWYFR